MVNEFLFDLIGSNFKMTGFSTVYILVRNHHSEEQDWKAVDKVAWVLLITIFVECFIEGLVFPKELTINYESLLS